MSTDALSTPCLLVDKSRLDRNLDRMQETAATNDVVLRPHVKTHKSVAVAGRQRDRGVKEVTVATVAEADTFIEAGFDDVRVAYPVTGREKHERLAAHNDRGRISCTVDTVVGAEQASAVHERTGQPLEVVMEVDVGHGRCGIPWHDADGAIELAERIVELPGLQLAGLLTHAGQAYNGPSGEESEAEALERAARQERDRILQVAVYLADAKIPGVRPEAFEISIGSTPTMSAFENAEHEGFRVTEIRPGNYVFHDAIQVALGAATLDECALSVLTTVISTKTRADGPDRAFVDAGKKVFTTDTGYGTEGHGVVLRKPETMTPASGVRVDHLSEEHGWLTLPDVSDVQVGDRLRIVPNHACVTVATQSRLYVVDEGRVVDTWPVTARQ